MPKPITGSRTASHLSPDAERVPTPSERTGKHALQFYFFLPKAGGGPDLFSHRLHRYMYSIIN